MELLMKNRLTRVWRIITIFTFLLLLSSSYNGKAQTQITPPSSQSATDSNSENEFNSNDTILKWKQSRDFAYMHYLDSLLRKQKDLKADTVRIDETGQIKRSRSSATGESGVNKILNSGPLKVFFWILALIFISFISYNIFFKNGFIGRKKNKLVTGNEEASSQELDDIFKYDQMVSDAEGQNEFNLAIRYLFLKTLKMLADKGLIDFTAEKTNKDYLREMKENSLFEDFQKITRIYEYAWYGKIDIDVKNYHELKQSFILFNETV